MNRSRAALLLLPSLSVGLPATRARAADRKVTIGFAMDSVKEERWQLDRARFLKAAGALGAEVIVAAAEGDDAAQLAQAKDLLAKGVDVLVVVPHSATAAAAIVEVAHAAGKKVVSYDRLIRDIEVDLYVSFDNVEVGRMQARHALKDAPKGNFLLIEGAQTDNNAKLVEKGHRETLQAAIVAEQIVVVSEKWSKDWSPSEASRHTEEVLAQLEGKGTLQAAVTANDGMAGGVVATLARHGLAGKVIVTGQDANLEACQRIAEGTQAMTVYKSIDKLAATAAEVAVAIAKGGSPQTTAVVHNGRKEIPAILLAPISVDRTNLVETVVKDGFLPLAAVYKNVPKKDWPKGK
jgi:D-xylose transport system substrate-binding protein